MKRLRRALVLAVLLSFCGGEAGMVAAQSPVGRVTGTVRDEAGKPVPDATVTATNSDEAPAVLTATADHKGRFSIPGVRRGSWVFAIAAPGFQTVTATGDVLAGRSNPPLNVTLPPSKAGLTGPASTLSGADIQTMLDTVEAAAASGDLAAAIAGYRDLITKVPALTSAYLRLGSLLEQKRDPAGALAAYRELARLEPDNARAAAAVARLANTP